MAHNLVSLAVRYSKRILPIVLKTDSRKRPRDLRKLLPERNIRTGQIWQHLHGTVTD